MFIRSGFAQTLLLRANGSQDAYTLINDMLGEVDGYAFETSDCICRDLGLHITQVYDAILRNMCVAFIYTGRRIPIGA